MGTSVTSLLARAEALVDFLAKAMMNPTIAV